ncbi:MAG: hypothetical protein IIY46_04025 [Lachnospiraceae bacterium]|nr:hypothetical protein [Lachnospiraceae bacterium]
MNGDSNSRFTGWFLIVVSILVGWRPARIFLMLMSDLRKASFIVRLRFAFLHIGGRYSIRLILCLIVLIVGIVVVIKNRDRRPGWYSRSKLRAAFAQKKIRSMTDTGELLNIINKAPLPDVKNCARIRRKELLDGYLSAGDREAIRKEVDSVTQTGMYDTGRTEFLVKAAAQYPEIVEEFWPKLKAWAHADSKSHSDKPGGFHTDRTDYYDYIRYPNGRTVANTNGRRRHTDSRGSYSDCHEDRHQDSTVHTDNANESKIARFKPYIRQ